MNVIGAEGPIDFHLRKLRERAERNRQMALLRLYFVRVSIGFCAIAVVASLIVHIWNR